MREIMRRASRVVFNAKHEPRTDVVVVHSAEFAGPCGFIGDMKCSTALLGQARSQILGDGPGAAGRSEASAEEEAA